MPKAASHTVVQLRVTLLDVEPPVWRRLIVPGLMRLDWLAFTIIEAMGWKNSHLHLFRIGDTVYGMDDEDAPEDEIDEATVNVATALDGVERFFFDYDFGDGWEHEVVVESYRADTISVKTPVCVDGARACPPEDCGGPGGYADLLGVLADPTHERHEEMTQWLGRPFDPEAFDLAIANASIQWFSKPRPRPRRDD